MNWKKVKLTSICKPKQWKTISASQFQNEGFPVYGANGKIGFYKEYTHEQETLLVTCRGATCGSINICEPKSYVNGNAMALDNLIIECNLKFLYHYLGKRGFNDVISGSAQPQITGQGLSKIEIPLPDLATQQHIAQVLDQADTLRQQNRQLLSYYDELLQSTFIDLFGDPVKNEKGWEGKKLGDLLAFMTSGSRGWAEYYSTFGSLFLRIQNVGYNKLKMNEIAFVNAPNTAEAKRTKVLSGDILLSITADLGRTAVIPENFGDAYISQHLALLRLKENIDSTFISELLSSEYCQRQFKSANKGGVKAGLNFNDIKSTNILLPPLPLQQHFAKIVEEIEAQKSLVQQLLAESEALFEGLLAEYFG